MLGCNNTISGDYTYTPQMMAYPDLPDWSGQFHCYSLSLLKHLYIAAGKGAEEFDNAYYYHPLYNKPEQYDIPMLDGVLINISYQVDRNYFLTLYENLRDQTMLVCENETAYHYYCIKAEPTEFILQNQYYYYHPLYPANVYFMWQTYSFKRKNVPTTEPDYVISGDGYTIHLWRSESEYYEFYYIGEIIPDRKKIEPFSMNLICANDNPEEIPDEILSALSECSIMTLEEAMMAAPTLESE
jgi:hypothetical protein